MLLLALWVCQLRFPPLSYPAIGLIIAVLLAGTTLLCAVKTFGNQASGQASTTPLDSGPHQPWTHPALLPGILFLAWVFIRWAMAGLPVAATDEVATWLWAGLYFCTGLFLLRSGLATSAAAGAPPLPQFLVKTLALSGLVCGIYAILQYHFLYDNSHAALLDSIGDRAPDRSEAALLHHLSLKRVASFLGDPNTYALFAAITIGASLDLIRSAQKHRLIWISTAAAAVLASLCGIFYTGSRGGVLDLLLVFVLFGTAWLATRRNCATRRGACMAIIVLLPILLTPTAPLTGASPASDPQPNPPHADSQSGWIWRSDTIRERVYYLEVGAKMIAMQPVTGLGPGSVNEHFGRLKSPDARETRHLHNWIVHTWAEYGLIGLALLGWFVAAILWTTVKHRLWQRHWLNACAILFVVMLFDGLLQTSWAHRELLSVTGLASACLVAATATPRQREPSKHSRLILLSAIAAVILLFLIVEIPYLSGKNHKQIASDALVAGDLAGAEKHALQASQWLSRDPEPYQVRAQVALQADNYSAARLLMEKALQLSPRSATLNSQLAELYRVLNRPNEEKTHILRALELYPSHPQYNLQYARYLSRTGEPAEAMSYATRARTYSYLEDEQQEIDRFINDLQPVVRDREAAPGAGGTP